MSALTLGILAHVDAGKTTLIESMLLDAKEIRKAGRVDHQDAFLDYDEQERKRGITIYSKEAGLTWQDQKINIIDTPGHADFSSEMERTLSVLDLGIVLISALDGVQSHTKTIWKCLDTYKTPAFLFVNKMDRPRYSKEELLSSMNTLSDLIVDMSADDWMEQAAALDEELLEEFESSGALQASSIQRAVGERRIFPVYFGSALKNEGVETLLDGLVKYAPRHDYPEEFGAKVFKITADTSGSPITHIKMTGGKLKARDLVGDQKVDQIRIYQGQGFQNVPEIQAGDIAALKGLSGLEAGDGLGLEHSMNQRLISSALYYELILPDGTDPVTLMGPLRLMMMEDPSLEIEFNEATQTIGIHLMGSIQKEILKNRILQNTGLAVEFGPGQIVYKETIGDEVFGYGHFEPLRHYAEVHLMLKPGKRNSGIQVTSKVPRDVLSLNLQRLILSALTERTLPGILTRSALTDVEITLIAGRAHQKHTSGGDFRQAARRAVRQGLYKAENILLEPYLAFEIETAPEFLSGILYALETREAKVEIKSQSEDLVKIEGRGPYSTLINFQEELARITRGTASFLQENDGYDVCAHPESVIEKIGYNPDTDRHNPGASVFCSNGTGQIVEWDEVEDHLHIPVLSEEKISTVSVNSGKVSEEELRKVFAAAGGSNSSSKKHAQAKKKRTDLSLEPTRVESRLSLPTCLIVDGYNMIYSWPDLKAVASTSLFSAREELISRLINYQGYKGWSMIIVFDGNRVKDNGGSKSTRGSSSIVYTPTGMNADSYIEKKVHDLRGKFNCIAATSDALIQNSVFSHGARRISARELEMQVNSVNEKAFNALKKR